MEFHKLTIRLQMVEIHCVRCLLSLLLFYVSFFISLLHMIFFLFVYKFYTLPSQLTQSFSLCSHALASSRRGFFHLLKLHLSHPAKESSKHWLFFPFHTGDLICIFSLSWIYFLDNFSLAVTIFLQIHKGFVTCNSPSVFSLLLSLVSFSIPL